MVDTIGNYYLRKHSFKTKIDFVNSAKSTKAQMLVLAEFRYIFIATILIILIWRDTSYLGGTDKLMCLNKDPELSKPTDLQNSLPMLQKFCN